MATALDDDQAPAHSKLPDDDQEPPRSNRFALCTVRLDAAALRPSWPIAIATLEQLKPWAVTSLRLGILTLVHECAREMASQDAKADLVLRLRELTEVLAHMPWES